MSDDRGSQNGSREISDLIGVELTLAVAVWLVVTIACFFFVGVLVGLILVVAGVVGSGWYLVRVVRNAEIRN